MTKISTILARLQTEWKHGGVKGVRLILLNVLRYFINYMMPELAIDTQLNRPRPSTHQGKKWARQWSDMVQSDPAIIGGDWSRTVFVSGFGWTGSSAAADLLYDGLEETPPPPETSGFRRKGLPDVMREEVSLNGFAKAFILGYHPSVLYPRDSSWYAHSLKNGNSSAPMPCNFLESSGGSVTVDVSKMTRAFLSPNTGVLVLDNALYRESLVYAAAYSNASWVFVVRDLGDQYVQRYMNLYSPTDFVAEIARRLELARAYSVGMGARCVWIKFENLVLRDETQSILKEILPVSYSSPTDSKKLRFSSQVSAANIGIQRILHQDIRRQFAEAQNHIYANLPLH